MFIIRTSLSLTDYTAAYIIDVYNPYVLSLTDYIAAYIMDVYNPYVLLLTDYIAAGRRRRAFRQSCYSSRWTRVSGSETGPSCSIWPLNQVSHYDSISSPSTLNGQSTRSVTMIVYPSLST